MRPCNRFIGSERTTYQMPRSEDRCKCEIGMLASQSGCFSVQFPFSQHVQGLQNLVTAYDSQPRGFIHHCYACHATLPRIYLNIHTSFCSPLRLPRQPSTNTSQPPSTSRPPSAWGKCSELPLASESVLSSGVQDDASHRSRTTTAS